MCGRGGPVESNLLFQCPPSVVLGKSPSQGPSVEKSPSTIALVERSAQRAGLQRPGEERSPDPREGPAGAGWHGQLSAGVGWLWGRARGWEGVGRKRRKRRRCSARCLDGCQTLCTESQLPQSPG